MESTFPFLAALLASVIHVITGPDHLAAVTTFAVEAKRKAWRIGLMWGIGHLIGMVLIGGLFMIFREIIPVEAISRYSEKLVALVLIFIGVWALRKLYIKPSHHRHLHVHANDTTAIHSHEHQHNEVSSHKHRHKDMPQQKNTTALGIGVLHGFAGIAHFLLFVPVLGFENNFDSISYVIGFGLGIVLAMSAFTLLLGIISSLSEDRHDNRLMKGINLVAALFALLVGIYWLIWS